MLLGLPAVAVVSDILVTGDAGMVLSRFLASLPEVVGTFLVIVVDVLGTRGVVDEVDGPALFVAVLRTPFVVPAIGFFSVLDEPPTVVRRAVEVAALRSLVLEEVEGTIDALLALPDTLGLLFSAPELTGAFFASSTELTEALDLCAVGAVAVAVRRVVDDTGGRVGGLLNELPGFARAAVVLAVVDGVGAIGRFAVVNGRFGGTADFRGEVTGVLLSSCGVVTVGLSSSEWRSGTPSSVASASDGSPASTEAMVLKAREEQTVVGSRQITRASGFQARLAGTLGSGKGNCFG